MSLGVGQLPACGLCEHMFVPAEATILHADADAFFASVEQRDDPSLRGRPVAVGPGVVMAASYEAKACGVHGGMHIRQARRLCPDIVAVPSRFDAYVAASKDLFDVFRRTAPVVEGLSMEEAFLDVRGLDHIRGSPPEVACRLRAEVRDEVGLVVSVGLATSKVVAKMASAAAKPDGFLHVAAGEERAFLHPLPIERVWGVGKPPRRGCARMASPPSGTPPRSARTRSRPSSAEPTGRGCTRSRPAAGSGPSAPGARAARSAPSAQLACGATRAATSSVHWMPSSTGSPGACERRTGSVAL